MKASPDNKYLKRLSMLFAGVVVAASFFTACSDDPAGSETDITVTAEFTADPDEPKAGETVTLNAEASSVSEGSPEFNWALAAPSGSEAEIDNPNSVTASFEVDEVGDYDVTLTVSSGDANDTASLTVKGLSPVEELSGNISEDTTFPSNTSYRVVGNVKVNNGATLTIEPGVIIEFEAETLFEVTDGAKLSAIGTEQDSIKFTGTEKNAGWWDGVFFNRVTHPDNEMEYVIIEYAGGASIHSSIPETGLAVGRSLYDARMSLNNSTIRHSGGLGLFIHANGAMPGSANNTFTDNTTGAAGVYTSTMHFLDSSSTYTGNDEDYVLVEANTLSDDATWQALDVPYATYGDASLNDAELTIEPGARFAFDAQSGLVINSGTIIAEGTEDDPILFTGLREEAGWWDGIFVTKTTHPDNLLNYIIVEYAGNEAAHGSTVPANLTVARSLYDASVSIKNSVFRNGAGVGLNIHSNGDIPGSENNTYTKNTEGPVELPTSKMHYLDSGSSFTGNADGEDFVWVNGNTREGDATWQPLNVPYGMKGSSAVEDGELTIEPGAIFAFDSQSDLVFGSASVIRAIGTEDDPILFTGIREEPGWWNGITVSKTEHPDNAMEYVTIEYGGGEEFHSSTEPANLTIGRSLYDAYLSVTNSTIQDSDDVGIYIHSNGATNANICSDNDFSGNAGDDCSDNQ
ncbi:MAG: hypothetical protein WD028_04870 [Balneolaceae bacterium]